MFSMQEQDENVKYICTKCNYRFTRKRNSKIALRCPYCGKEDVVENNIDINRMIDES